MKQVWMKAGCVMAAAAALSTSAYAADPAACRNVRFADVGWTDIAATTGLASTVFEGLGYHPVKTIASVPITFTGIKSKQIDVFLGYWSPTMDPIVAPFVKAGQVKVLASPNLTGAKYTLAVPEYVYNGGLKTFADIQKYADKLDGKIDEAFYTRKTDEYRAEQARLAEEIGRQQQAGPPQVENLAELATRAAERFEQQPAHEKRKLLRYIVEDCQWTQGHLTYRWKPPFERAVRGEQEQMLRAA